MFSKWTEIPRVAAVGFAIALIVGIFDSERGWSGILASFASAAKA